LDALGTRPSELAGTFAEDHRAEYRAALAAFLDASEEP
jgi:hypothetical protein